MSAIIQKLDIFTDEVVRTAYSRNGHDGVTVQYKDSVFQKVVEWLQENGYPEEIVECAMDYVKSFHYVDDYRYACTYIRYHQSEKSRLQIKMKLYERGVPSDLIEQALEDEYTGEEDRLIDRLLEKKQYDADTMDQKEKQKIYQYLMRRGFRSDAIRRRMNAE